MNVEQMWDYLMDMGIATEEELQLVTDINGYTTDTMEAILYARIGYRDFEQLEEEEED